MTPACIVIALRLAYFRQPVLPMGKKAMRKFLDVVSYKPREISLAFVQCTTHAAQQKGIGKADDERIPRSFTNGMLRSIFKGRRYGYLQ